MRLHRLSYCILSLALGLAQIGCSRSKDDLPREPVAGTVTMDGKPLPEAAIQFTPTGETKATGVVAKVEDGKFSIPREEGLVPGTYMVSISHAEQQEIKSKKAAGSLSKSTKMGKEQIPARFNTQSKLTAEIKKGGVSDLSFPLESK
jgi:hypothetical protein